MNSIASVYIGNRKSKLLQFKYDDNKLREKLRNWKCLHPQHSRGEATDCVVSSLHFIDIITNRKLAEDLSKYLNTFKHVITSNAILVELFKSLGNQHGLSEYDYDESIPDPYQKWIDILKHELKKEHLTMGLFTKQSTAGHAVIIYKDSNDQLHLIDSQQLTVKSTEDDIANFFIDEDYVKMILIKTPSKRALSPSVSSRKTKSFNGQPVKRTTRRSRSPESMSISPKIISNKTRKRKRSSPLKIRKTNKKRSLSPLTKKARYK